MKKPITLIVLALVLFSACKDQKDGLWGDNIQLSQKSFNVGAAENTVQVNTKSKNWWINEIALNEVALDINQNDKIKPNFIFENQAFTFERIEGNKIKVILNKNFTKQERKIQIGLQNGNYFDGLTIIQSPE